jgi:DNA polymerase elongation subunit (family B)
MGKWKNYKNMKLIYNKDNTYEITYSKNINDNILEIIRLNNSMGQDVYDIETTAGDFHAGIGELIVKNTDSIFLKFKNNIKGKQAIMPSINKAKELVNEYRPLLKKPHDLEYEKVYYPFIIFSKKRYVANKYENDDQNYKLSYMGIALKRRDNANIVKKIYGQALDIILNEQDINKSIEFVKKALQDLINNKYPLEDLSITKTIRSGYKDISKIAHAVLANRMIARNPGINIQSNDRIRYIYIQVKETGNKKLLQGDMIEDFDYVKEKKLKPDYVFYMTNQIMKPICQLYSLVLEDMDEYKKDKNYFDKLKKDILVQKNGNIEKTTVRIDELREREVEKLIFEKYIIMAKLKQNEKAQITNYFKKVSK